MSIRGINSDDDICFYCEEWCSNNASCSDRYMCLQCYLTDEVNDNNKNLISIYVCDKCFDEFDFEDGDELEISNKRFKVDYIIRMND